MTEVRIARHLYRFFPSLEDRELSVEARTAGDVVRALDALAPGFADYVVDERGALRRHVNMFVGERAVVDRAGLSDPVRPDGVVHIYQALSGG